jgi:bifunctional non-homologous end joining protein LigD
MLARSAELPPADAGWGFELKWDGVRAIAYLEEGLRIESRRGEDVTARYPELAGLAEASSGRPAILDGEIVALDEEGRPGFQLLQRRMGLTSEAVARRRASETPVTYVAFDLLHLGDRSMLELPYAERRQVLDELGIDGDRWRTPAYHLGDGVELLAAARERDLEGLVAKRLDSPYRPGRRSGEWVKLALRRRIELVIGGWTVGEGARGASFGALLVGYWDRDPEEAARQGHPQGLVYAGRVGSGFTDDVLRDLAIRLSELRREQNPFDAQAPRGIEVVFCAPELVCEVEYKEWTDEGTLRAPSFKGLRDDLDPREIVRA